MKEISQIFSALKIVYLTTLCLVLCINFSMEDARLSCGETDRYLKVGSGEHISISPLTFKKVKPSAKSSIHDL